MIDLINQDRVFFLYLNNLGSPYFDMFWLMITDKWIWIPLYIIFLYLLFKNYKAKSVLFILIFIALGITCADQIAGIFKDGIARLRPCHDETLIPFMRSVTCGGKFGFFSSHAANTFFLATFLSLMLKNYYKYLPYCLFVWAAVVSYSRIYLGVHFPLDIAFGAAVGILLGGFFAELAKRVAKKQGHVYP